MANDNTPVDVSYLMQRVGMTRHLAEHTMSAIAGGLQTGDGRTEGWLRQVSRDALKLSGVEPFAADMIAHYQLRLCIGTNNGMGDAAFLIGGAVAGAGIGTAYKGTNNGMIDGGAVVVAMGVIQMACSIVSLSAGATKMIADLQYLVCAVVTGIAVVGIVLGVPALVVQGYYDLCTFKRATKSQRATLGKTNNTVQPS